ncbi:MULTISPECIES: chorismate--pyruvate lyase family protein [unclassified Undibacterium]|uniref:chorismate--pyruvate lyase family protein n=1 Tax=unclassified Undibacterium TaxID=2630295 RepID=UPI002AC9365A|nr:MULTISPECIES: chorismate lyase [unclassified Undibacterium]MEB0140446.1 chorismate lyase [Undibacterium sp. CCC2.1]MEB0173545.1 chorismate lyase [Undibacterium sp. CCC1.1]MEB0177471.1 chorismate lyase [Undibacterium sp. CCC3.4]MEB0214339.1 chorismate lyase [Undibacterium sp. 5I2]WPX44209.1 chorismate lyase [Undibacterium sp. CCC3.4]
MPRMLERVSTSAARWHEHAAAVVGRGPLQQWLSDRGSLTARLQARCQQFRVQRLSQQQARCLPDEAGLLGLPRACQTHEREVILRCDAQAIIYGHTVVPLTATAAQWPLFAALGEQSLGTTLFHDPLVIRGPLSFARLHPRHPLMQRLRQILPEISATSLPARRSLFWRKAGVLLVTEVFLPALAQLPAAVYEKRAFVEQTTLRR